MRRLSASQQAGMRVGTPAQGPAPASHQVEPLHHHAREVLVADDLDHRSYLAAVLARQHHHLGRHSGVTGACAWVAQGAMGRVTGKCDARHGIGSGLSALGAPPIPPLQALPSASCTLPCLPPSKTADLVPAQNAPLVALKHGLRGPAPGAHGGGQ